jgi:protein-S-isoprenylcysteine O-methyltransferase Ste14
VESYRWVDVVAVVQPASPAHYEPGAGNCSGNAAVLVLVLLKEDAHSEPPERRWIMRRAYAEALLAVVALIAAVVTALFPTWFETLFEGSPDSGSGALEWIVATGMIVVSLGLSFFARRDFRSSRIPPPEPARDAS